MEDKPAEKEEPSKDYAMLATTFPNDLTAFVPHISNQKLILYWISLELSLIVVPVIIFHQTTLNS